MNKLLLLADVILLFVTIVLLTGCFPYELRKDASVLKYNYYQKEYQYAPQDATLQYNYYEKRYEFAR